MYTAIIIDDEPTARDILESHLSKIDVIELIASCKNAAEGFSELSKQQIDLVFLDINMPEVTGLMFAKAIQGKTAVVFTTAYREYAIDGFDVHALDYLLKPISLERLMVAVNKLEATQNGIEETQEYDFTFFRCDRKMRKVNFKDISYIESCGDYVKIHAQDEVLITRETMTSISTKLLGQNFIRVHRSFIIAVSKIKSYTNEEIIISKTSIPISRSYRDQTIGYLTKIK